MNETKLNKKLSLAGYLCLIGCTLMITLSMTVSPREWMNVGLVIAVILGVLAAGLSASSVSQQHRA